MENWCSTKLKVGESTIVEQGGEYPPLTGVEQEMAGDSEQKGQHIAGLFYRDIIRQNEQAISLVQAVIMVKSWLGECGSKGFKRFCSKKDAR